MCVTMVTTYETIIHSTNTLQCTLPLHTHTHAHTHTHTHTLPPPLHTHTHTLRQVTQSKRLAEEEAKPQPHKDYSLKAGEKIHINFGVRARSSGSQCLNLPCSCTKGLHMLRNRALSKWVFSRSFRRRAKEVEPLTKLNLWSVRLHRIPVYMIKNA